MKYVKKGESLNRIIVRIASSFLVALMIAVLPVVVFRIHGVGATEASVSVVNATTGARETVFPPTVHINDTFAVNITISNVLLLAGWQVKLEWDGEIIKINNTIEVTVPSDNVFGTYADLTGLTTTGESMFLACTIRTGAPFTYVNVTQRTLCQIRFTIVQNGTEPLSTVLHLVQEAENLVCTKLVEVNASEISFTPVDGAYEMLPEGTIIVPIDYSSIQVAINSASEGSIIFVRSGTYYENVVVNKALHLYGESTETTIIDGGYTGEVVRIVSHNITISHFTIRKSGTTQNPPNSGLLLDHVQNFTAHRCNIIDNVVGIRLDNSLNSHVSRSFISNNLDGISLNWSSDIVIIQNDIVANQRYGIYLNSSSGSILENTLKSNSLGLMLYHSSGNIVYHNNFMENQQNAYAHESYNNVWDHGYPSGGNYWSTYVGFDIRRGSHQNETGSDGIGDSSYFIDSDNVDNYPLMKKYPGSIHDVGVTSVTTSKTVMGQGNNLFVNVTIMNYGLYTETFNVTIFANSTSIKTQNITLTSLDSVTVPFAWNSSGFARAYMISVNVTQVARETGLADNTFVDGIVKVTCIGDINGDYAAEAKDFVLVKMAIPSTPGSPRWNANADVNDDLVVDAKDLQLVKNHIPSLLEP